MSSKNKQPKKRGHPVGVPNPNAGRKKRQLPGQTRLTPYLSSTVRSAEKVRTIK